MVADELKDKATEIFHQLKKAYEENNLQAVSEILEVLEQGGMLILSSDSLSDKKRLQLKIKEIGQHLTALQQEIEILKQSETYQTIMKIQNWDDYFAQIKIHLEDEIRKYKQAEKQDGR